MTTIKQLAASWRQSTALGLILFIASSPAFPQQNPTGYTFRSQSELVLVNVTARDSHGNLVRDLKQGDFTILEDNKTQQLSSFDVENTDIAPTVAQPSSSLLGPTRPNPAKPPEAITTQNTTQFKDRRLIVLFFDLSSMQPDEIDRAVTAAQTYVDKQMAAADLIAVVTLSNSLNVNLEFTEDRAALKKTLAGFGTGAGEGFDAGTTGTTEGTADTGQAFAADDTEYNIFNTDRRLEALHSIADRLAGVDQKKSLIYFSSGMDRTGIENQTKLHETTNTAIRTNLTIYKIKIHNSRGYTHIAEIRDLASDSDLAHAPEVPACRRWFRGGKLRTQACEARRPTPGSRLSISSTLISLLRRRWLPSPATRGAEPSWTPMTLVVFLPECSRTRLSIT